MTRRWRVRPADRPTRRETGAPISRRRQPPPTHCGASRRNGRDLIIAIRPAHKPLPSLLSAAAAQEVQAVPRTDNDTRRTNSARSAPPILHDPQRAKGSLNRRFEWFSLVTFFLQKRKLLVPEHETPHPAPAGSVPPIPRRRQPPPTHCGAPRRNGRDLIIATRPAYQPLPSLLSAAAAQEVQAIPRTDNVPRRTNSAKLAPPNLHLPAPRQGVLRP